ncbi:MAG: arylsulfatase [Coraliomargarita sp.]
MNPPVSVFRLIAVAILALAAANVVHAADSPNVVIFLSDDQGWGDLSSSGNTDLATPHIDSLAKEGVSFDRFYVSPVCSPTRAEFLTGRHHARAGVYGTSRGGERMDLDEVTVADLFKKAGYRTGAFGKWHNGMQYPYHPNGRGFDEFYGFCSGHWGNYYDAMFEHNGRIVQGEGFCVDDFTNKAMDFISEAVKQEKPFLAYLPYNTPHSPMQVPDEYWEKFAKRQLEMPLPGNRKGSAHLRCALAMCENLDWNVGRVLAKLDELGVTENTIVIWFHDNGPNGLRWNGGMRGRKGQTDEGGVRSPLYLKWPGKVKAGTEVAEICSARDLLPTLCSITGVPIEKDLELDGMDLTPLFTDASSKTAAWPDRILINHFGDKVSARSQGFRLDDTGRLYDMIADPGQTKEVNKAFPKVEKELSKAVQRFRKDLLPGYKDDDRPFVIAHPDAPLTQLPARDAVATGQIKRSNIYPNCSYYANWVNTKDKIKFTAEVAESGKFKVVLYYASKSAGAKCELRFKDSVLPFEIAEAHDVPEIGAEQDRDPRIESYVKAFKAIPIGEIELQKGKGELILRALEIPGEEAFEFRMLTLERLEG